MKELFVPVVINDHKETKREFVYNIDEVPFLDLLLTSNTSTTRKRSDGGNFFIK